MSLKVLRKTYSVLVHTIYSEKRKWPISWRAVRYELGKILIKFEVSREETHIAK